VGSYPGVLGPLAVSVGDDWNINQLNGLTPNLKYTGNDNEATVNQWIAWYNVSQFVHPNDLADHSPACVPYNGVFPPNETRFGYDGNCLLWLSPEVISGTADGVSSTPFQDNDPPTNQRIWVSDGKRVADFLYSGDISFKGITMRRHLVDMTLLENSTLNPNNTNYVMNHDPTGIVPLTRYFAGMDTFMALPHFLGADPDIANRFAPGSFNPVNDTFNGHVSYLDIEPISGLTMAARKRLMAGFSLFSGRYISLKYSPYENVTTNFNVKRQLYIPYFWANESADISDSDANSFTLVYTAQKASKVLEIVFLVIGGIMFSLMVGAYFFNFKAIDDTI